jgi:hypothetical protein
MKKLLFIFLFFNISIFAYDKSVDEKNVYFSSTHFKAIAGIEYQNDQNIEDLATKLLDYAEQSWQKEVEELGFTKPRNSDTKKIDIYIGNKQAYNYETKQYETIPSNYAGWATSYPSDNTPNFVMNPSISDELLKVTISHEFFHTIQYAYFDETQINDTKWTNNIWWLEATAVIMEDEVYDDIDDYINYLDDFFNKSYKNIETYDGSHEYSMAIFAKYIKEKYGLTIIKESLSKIETSGDDGFFEILDDLLQSYYNSSIQIALNEFANWVLYKDEYFEEGSLYPSITKFSSSYKDNIEKGGILIIDDIDAILTYRVPKVYQKNSTLDTCSISNSTNMTQEYISSLSDGWHLLGADINITDLSIFDNTDFIWQYKSGVWEAYSPQEIYQDAINNSNIPTFDQIDKNSGFWILKNN